MAFQAFVSIKGKRQGQFKGESTKANRQDWIAVLGFTMGLKSPREAGGAGQATGRHQIEPVTFIKEWGAASPQGLTACSTNEVLTTVLFEFVTADAAGVELVSQTVTLTDATISQISRATGDPGQSLGSILVPTVANTKAFETWSITFAKIQVEDKVGKTIYTDDLFAPGA